MSAGWQALRATDRDLALALLFAPGASRELIADRMSLAIEAETALKLASEPMLAAIRLQWWVEAIEQGSGGPVPLMQRLQRHLDSGAATPVALASQIGIWQDRLATAPEANPETTPETNGACWAEFFGSLLPAQEQAARQVGRALVDSDARVGDEALGWGVMVPLFPWLALLAGPAFFVTKRVWPFRRRLGKMQAALAASH